MASATTIDAGILSRLDRVLTEIITLDTELVQCTTGPQRQKYARWLKKNKGVQEGIRAQLRKLGVM